VFVKKCTLVFLLFATFSFFPGFVRSADEEVAGQAAEKAGRFREALTHYTAALQATLPCSEAEQRLLDRAAGVSSKVTPLPALPAEAERRLVRGQTLVESAKEADAFLRAASEFRAAVRAAPWFSDAHYNLGVVLDKAQRFNEAIRSLKRSILVAPNSKEAGEAQRLIYRIEVRQEEAQRAEQKTEQERVAQQRAEQTAVEERRRKEQAINPERLAGTWRVRQGEYGTGRVRDEEGTAATLRFSGNQISGEWWWRNGSGSELKGVLSGNSLSGSMTTYSCCPKSPTPGLFTAEVSPDGRTITIEYRNPAWKDYRDFYRLDRP